ncbi:putative reverse transcriptase domain-containing protein [Tanacetum coccineum]
MITDKYCPRGEIKKLESEYWNLKVRGTDLMTYNQRFQELALMCDRMFPEESAKVERYVGGLTLHDYGMLRQIKASVYAKGYLNLATEMMDQKDDHCTERQAENKRKLRDPRKQPKTHNHSRETMWHGLTLLGLEIRSLMEEPNLYVPSVIITTMGHVLLSALTAKSLVTQPVTVRFDLLLITTTNKTKTTTKGPQGTNPRVITCFECGVQGHYRSDCPKLKNGNQGNRAGNGNAVARAYVMGSQAGTNPNSNVCHGTSS